MSPNLQSNIEASYRRQAADDHALYMPSRYTAPDSVDNWRHTRMLSSAKTLVDAMPASHWLTVGDGNYGSDAAYLTSLGVRAVATSLVASSLKIAAEKGYIREYREENAERLSLGDGAMDFVLCKEAYHHFPRPPIALYEMLRVARVGVLLIEPIVGKRLLNGLKTLVKRAVRGDTETLFEPAGNFIYRLNIQEMAHLMTAAGEACIAYRRFNDFYMPGLGAERAVGWTRGHVLTRTGVAAQDALARAGLLAWGLASVIVFKGMPPSTLLAALKSDGFTVQMLPANPYAT